MLKFEKKVRGQKVNVTTRTEWRSADWHISESKFALRVCLEAQPTHRQTDDVMSVKNLFIGKQIGGVRSDTESFSYTV